MYCPHADRHDFRVVSKRVGQWPKFTARSSVRPEAMVATKGTKSGQNHPVHGRTMFKSPPDPLLHSSPAYLSVSVLCVK